MFPKLKLKFHLKLDFEVNTLGKAVLLLFMKSVIGPHISTLPLLVLWPPMASFG